jgi:hypothetical protein
MHDTSRRFTTQMFTLAGATLSGKKTLRAASVGGDSPSASSGVALLGHMKWLNEPASANISG